MHDYRRFAKKAAACRSSNKSLVEKLAIRLSAAEADLRPGATVDEVQSLEGVSTNVSVVTVTLSKNIALSLGRVVVNSLVALLLPAYLTHRLPITTYGAWVLILQLGAFVSYLDFGVQTAVSKFVAEHSAKNDHLMAGRYATAGLVIMTLTALLGIVLTLGLSFEVPRLFRDMPVSLYRDVRISVILVGVSLSFGLVCSVFSAVFLGLQRYAIPMGIAILNKGLYTTVILATVLLHGSLASMGAAVAVVNVSTGLLQIVAWRRLASQVRVSFHALKFDTLGTMTSYCLLLAVWTIGMLCVTGLDVTIVGHYDFSQTAFYATATLPTSFIILIMASMLGPMMPASSALSTQRSSQDMGVILARVTRYSTLLLLLTGIPLVVYGGPILKLWVGPVYAANSLLYLRVLVVANILRSLCAPYSTLVVATGRMRDATMAPILEAIVNLASSIYFAGRYGAVGVAYGTLIGSFASVFLHFIVSMRLTRRTLDVARCRLLVGGILRPAIILLPSFFFLAPSRYAAFKHALPAEVIIWTIATLSLAWFVSLDRADRERFTSIGRRRAKTPVVTA
jgi:O-antigen/teichoic acid export membrane protein